MRVEIRHGCGLGANVGTNCDLNASQYDSLETRRAAFVFLLFPAPCQTNIRKIESGATSLADHVEGN